MLIWCLIVMGEAAERISAESRAEIPRVDWSGMMMRSRDLLVNYKGGLEPAEISRMVSDELPTVRDEIGRYLAGNAEP